MRKGLDGCDGVRREVMKGEDVELQLQFATLHMRFEMNGSQLVNSSGRFFQARTAPDPGSAGSRPRDVRRWSHAAGRCVGARRSRGGGQPRAAVGQARVLLRSRETANRTSSPANLCASESVRRSRVRYARSGACMAQKQTTHQSLHEPGDTWTSCRPAARAERAAVRQSQEQSNRFSLQLCG